MPVVIEEVACYTFVLEDSCMLASWDDSVKAESEEFLESVSVLVQLLIKDKITCLYITSGTPLGGTITENLIAVLENAGPHLALKKIALLESLDFHWDNTVMLTLEFIKDVSGLDTQIRSFAAKQSALNWLKDSA